MSAANTTLQPEMENALADLLNRECNELAQFIGLLEEELDALALGSADAVRDCATRKQHVLGRIFATRDAVNAVTRRTASNPHLQSVESWLARSSSLRIRRAFDQLTEHADEARQLNQLASRLIQIKLRGVNERLDVLRPDGWMDPVYHSEGFAAAQVSSKGIIGRA
jgi:flagellar biosynthesis/type III secretory pathway chaperone